MTALRNLSSAAKAQVVGRVRQLSHQHGEMVFACIHGSFLEVSGGSETSPSRYGWIPPRFLLKPWWNISVSLAPDWNGLSPILWT
jgi:hypothetical protein